ncbi:hypothetical protein [Gemella morbillorum]
MNVNDVEQLLKLYDGELIDCCLFLYESFQEESIERQVECFQAFCDNFRVITSNKTQKIPRKIKQRDLDILTDTYGKYVDELLGSALKKAYSSGFRKIELYDILWRSILNRGIITDSEEFAFCIYFVVIDKKIPYYYLDIGLKMENEEFSNFIDQCQLIISKVRFILSNNFSQKTEEASLLIKELQELDTFEEQTVVMATILSTLREEQKRLRKYIDKLLDN